jgi:hypothetical protein
MRLERNRFAGLQTLTFPGSQEALLREMGQARRAGTFGAFALREGVPRSTLENTRLSNSMTGNYFSLYWSACRISGAVTTETRSG